MTSSYTLILLSVTEETKFFVFIIVIISMFLSACLYLNVQLSKWQTSGTGYLESEFGIKAYAKTNLIILQYSCLFSKSTGYHMEYQMVQQYIRFFAQQQGTDWILSSDTSNKYRPACRTVDPKSTKLRIHRLESLNFILRWKSYAERIQFVHNSAINVFDMNHNIQNGWQSLLIAVWSWKWGVTWRLLFRPKLRPLEWELVIEQKSLQGNKY